ncbi:hypothetical protein CLOP_g10176 [Closterium sp. NIES-67]|nr:hypothetical protein CLOP_g10176 [Closterium sp. NIES-67]
MLASPSSSLATPVANAVNARLLAAVAGAPAMMQQTHLSALRCPFAGSWSSKPASPHSGAALAAGQAGVRKPRPCVVLAAAGDGARSVGASAAAASAATATATATATTAKDEAEVSQAILRANEEVAMLSEELEGMSPLAIMDRVLELYGVDAAIAFSGAEDVLLVELAASTGRPFRVFCLDTGRLNPETYRFLHQVEQHYGLRMEVLFPDAAAVEQLVGAKGLFSFYTDGHFECCSVRKVQPLKRKLRTLRAWITGQRRDQSVGTRANVPLVQVDPGNEGAGGAVGTLVKVNPLALVAGSDVWHMLEALEVPTNPLHAQGFTSIGCEPCTRPVLPHQHEREGRWWWEEAASKECGLHQPSSGAAAAAAGSKAAPAGASAAAALSALALAPSVGPGALATRGHTGVGIRAAAEAELAAAEVARREEEERERQRRREEEAEDIYVDESVVELTARDVELLLTPAAAATPEEQQRVGHLSASSWLLVVYAPWCPFCQALEPSLLHTAGVLGGEKGVNTRVAKFRGDRDMRQFARDRLNTSSFPTILSVRPRHSGQQGQQQQAALVVKMRGERRDSDSLLNFVRQLS